MKYLDTPLILIILFFVFLYALVFSIRSVVIPLRVAALKTQQETEVVKGNKIYEIVKSY